MKLKCIQKYPLYEHQLKTVLENENRTCFALLYDVGTGKTPATIAILREKYAKQGRVLNTLILCPLSITNQWKQEFIKFAGDNYEKRVVVAIGSSKDKIELIKNGGNIIITNYDSLVSDAVFNKLMEFNFDIVVLDESHFCKSINSARTKRATKIAHEAHYRYILTGTPQTNGIQDLWSQFNILCPGEIFHNNFYVFKNTYFVDKNQFLKAKMGAKYFPNYVFREDCLGDIKKKLQAVSHIVKKEDCLDLPPLVKMIREVELEDEQKRLYDSMEKDFVAYISNNKTGITSACVANLALVKGMRLQQLLAGIFAEENGETMRIKTNRPKILGEVLEEIGQGHKIIIWTVFVPTYEDIAKVCKEKGFKAVLLTGQQNVTQKQANIDAFRNDPCVNVLIANQASGGTGLNLTEATYSIYYTKNFNLAHDIQSEARNYRSGSEIHDKITRIDLVSRGTIDAKITKALAEKKELSEILMECGKC